MRKSLFTIVVLLIIITFVQILVTQERTSQKKQLDQSSPQQQAQSAATQIGGSFTLTNQTGKTVHDSDFRGRLMLVYFGFTQCPDECPVTLMMIRKAMDLLGSKADQVVPLFISVDPQHDTAEVLKNYLSNFGTRIVGLTGTAEQIKDVENAYKMYATKNAGAAPADYTIDHSSYIYIMGKDGKFLAVLPSGTSDQEVSRTVERYLSQ